MAPPTNEPRYNERIRAREVRLIGPDGGQLGIKALPDALALARQMDLDLVEVAPMANPPVCRVMDYGKFRYEESQKAKESRRKASHVSVKEVKFRPKIGKGDFDTKVRHMQDFLHAGHKVKVTLQFRGREMAHPELGARILDQALADLGPLAKVETQARLEGRNMTMVLAPDKKAHAAALKQQEAEAAEARQAQAAAAAMAEAELAEAEATEAQTTEADTTEAETTEAETTEADTTEAETTEAETTEAQTTEAT